MRIRIERLRVWLLVSAALLMLVLAGFIGMARYLRRHWLGRIPAKLGVNVKVDTSGITLSHTYQGQTDYVVHAGREVEHADGKVALHDVWIKLCGRQQKRADIVRGDDWEWDKKAGVIRALGVVHIELRDGTGKQVCTATPELEAPDGADSKATWVTTSNLIYMQNLGVAATSAPIDFISGKMEGHAVGADYASDSGILMLHSAVSMKGMSAGHPVEVEAASAELDGDSRITRLTGAKYTTGAGSALHTVQAEQAVLHLRADQTLERIEAQGEVTMRAGGGTVSAAKADVAMNAAGHPVSALLTGGVRYAVQEMLIERHGEAEQAAITFDGKASTQAERAVFTGAAHLVERVRTNGTKSLWNTRELTAAKLDIVLAPGADHKNQVRDAEATGGARFSELSAGAGASGMSTTEIAADDLKAHFVEANGSDPRSTPRLQTIAGRGHTLVRQVNEAGGEQTSAGDALDAWFRPASAAGKKSSNGATAGFPDADALANAVQTGHVTVTHKEAAKNGKDNEMRASAQQANYDGASDRMTLSGGVLLTQTGSQLWASQVVIGRTTGDAQAMGDVKVEYAVTNGDRRQSAENGTEPLHVLAQRADLDHATDTAIFHGAPVRIWQNGSQVQAPVIEFRKAANQLLAHGDAANGQGGAQVHTVLMSAGREGLSEGQAANGTPPCAVNESASKPNVRAQDQTSLQVVRITSGGLIYSGTLGEAQFTGGIRADMADATVRAATGVAYLKDTKTASAVREMPSLNGHIDRIIAKGQVTIAQPKMRAAGEQLTYTAKDENFLLTGDAKHAPKATDEHGNVTTGAELRFHRMCNGSGGDTVEVLNSLPDGPEALGATVHTVVQADGKRGQRER